jgi:hypothetical protein
MKIRWSIRGSIVVALATLATATDGRAEADGLDKLTSIRGIVSVPKDLPPGLKNIRCSDLVVVATSRESVQEGGPDFQFQVPKWTRLDIASGTWSTGACAFGMTVPPNSHFVLSASGRPSATLPCELLLAPVANVGGWIMVGKGQSRAQNFTVTSVRCAS